MTPDHADKMEITVVFQCPPKGREPILAVFEVVGWYALPLGRGGEGLLGGLGRGSSALATL